MMNLYDYLIDEMVEIDQQDICEFWSEQDGFSYIENYDGLVYKVKTEDLHAYGLHPIMEGK